jgi:hypothetical protein
VGKSKGQQPLEINRRITMDINITMDLKETGWGYELD